MASYNLYIADGSTTTYAYTFDQLDSSSVEVRLNNVIVTTGYTIDTVAKTVTFVGAPDAGTSIMLRRLTSVLLRYRFGQGAAFTGQNLDADFDQLLYAFQEYSDLTDYARGRTLRVPDSDPEIALIPSVAERAGKYLGFNSEGNPQVLLPDTDSAAGVAAELAKTNLSVDELHYRDAREAGCVLVGTFEAGTTITVANRTVLYRTNGQQYKWAGALPKAVPLGSSPASTGGISAGAWVPLHDVSLREELAAPTGYTLVGGAASADSVSAVSADVAKLKYPTYRKASYYASQLAAGTPVVIDCHGDSTMWGATTINVAVQDPNNQPAV
ncbi:phage tail fiber protein, partial [Cutibacterium acnes]